MLRLITAPDIVQARIWCDLLCEAGLPASVLREHFASAHGLMPPAECLPEIWLEYEEHASAARQLLLDLAQLPQRRWQCRCGETVEGGFEQCWNCGGFMQLGRELPPLPPP
ncbi:DUF2007 domain-containing protein [Diaphorobacter ruginosibacter]|uniref:DUF2007 domain-containing protein n=1 Tax=Diaphorobacter ruginosibacter TaxID=1715720 RepID=UPI0033425A17